MKQLYAAIVWHTGDGMTTLRLEKRHGMARYPGDYYRSILTGVNASDLVVGDKETEQDMLNYVKEHGIILTTDKIAVKVHSYR